MCGIMGYIGPNNAVPFLLGGLKRLEYRGYDSTGICCIEENKLELRKIAGKIEKLKKIISKQPIHSNLGIAHTRWATHGAPNKVNAHPHFDCKKEIAIAHNGIIENYSALKKLLKKEGHQFESETDSEVLAHLIEKFYGGRLEEAVRKALLLVDGTYGLVVIHKKEKKIVAARNGSPLILGIGKKEFFVASDAAAILKRTKKVVYLKDKDIAVISRKKFSISNLEKKPVEREVEKINWGIEQIERGNFSHFTLKEIFEQPQTIQDAFRGRINKKNNSIVWHLSSMKKQLNEISKITIIGCGTSWHAALIGKYLIQKMAKMPVIVEYASEFRYMNPPINEKDLVIAISQSGETADTIAGLKIAVGKNSKTLGIVNVVGSSIAREAGKGIYIHSGPEIGVASTKVFTGEIICLLLFALFLAESKKTISLIERKKIVAEIKRAPFFVQQILNESKKIEAIAKKYYKKNNALYLGRGINFPVALEGALKLKEISYIHAEGYPAAELKHGPLALIDENFLTIFLINSSEELNKKVLNNIEEVKARKGKVICISHSNDEKIIKLADEVILVPKTIEELEPIVNVIPLQLLAYYIAVLRKCNVDQPKNLAKSVTVE